MTEQSDITCEEQRTPLLDGAKAKEEDREPIEPTSYFFDTKMAVKEVIKGLKCSGSATYTEKATNLFQLDTLS